MAPFNADIEPRYVMLTKQININPWRIYIFIHYSMLKKNMLFVLFQPDLNCIQISLSFEIQFPNPIESFPVFRKSLYCCTGQSFIYLAVPDNYVGLCFFPEERSTGTSNWSLLINANTHHCYSAVIPVLKKYRTNIAQYLNK